MIVIAIILIAIAGVVFVALRRPKKPEIEVKTTYPRGREKAAGLVSGVGIPIGNMAWWNESTPEKPGYFELLGPDLPLTYNGDRHIVTFGPTGSGKNITTQTPALLQYDSSALVIDVKGQLCSITARRRTEMGHEVFVLNPFDVLGLPTSTYNPLAHIDPGAITFASDCRRIAEGLVDTSKGDHWTTSALDIVDLLIQWVIKYEDEKHLVRVRQLLNLPEDFRREFFQKISMCDDMSLAEGANRYISDSDEVRDCIQTAVVQLGFMRDEAIAQILKGGKNEIAFADLKRKNMTVYVIIPPELLYTHGKFLRLITMSALGELLREKAAPKEPVLFMLDEFAQLGALSLIENATSIVRDYKIRLWLILQNIPQLKDLYNKRWESLLSSAGIIQMFTPNDMETAEYFSRRSGVRTVSRKSESYSAGSSAGGANSGSSTTYSETEVVDLPTSDILGIASHFQLLFCAGMEKYILAYRVPYWKQPHLNGMFDPDPYHMTTDEREHFEARGRRSQTLQDTVSPPAPPFSTS